MISVSTISALVSWQDPQVLEKAAEVAIGRRSQLDTFNLRDMKKVKLD
jgi:CO dehydrogenase/acetyl-CoA synthase delta subunit